MGRQSHTNGPKHICNVRNHLTYLVYVSRNLKNVDNLHQLDIYIALILV